MADELPGLDTRWLLMCIHGRYVFPAAWLSVTLFLLALGGCRAAVRKTPATSRVLSSVDIAGRTMFLDLKPGVSLSAVVKVDVFSDIKNDPPVTVLEKRFGKATRTWRDRYGKTWLEFQTTNARVEAGTETDDSPPAEGGTAYAVYVVPGVGIAAIVHSEVMELIRDHALTTSIIIRSLAEQEAIACELGQGGLARCRWSTSAAPS